MKRAAILLVILLIAFLATRKRFVSKNSNSDKSLTIEPVKAQTVVTLLPPLTNLAFHAQNAATAKPSSTPLQQLESPESSTAIPTEQTNEQTLRMRVAATASALPANADRRDPMARLALGMVGIDPTAEEYWAAAINDPTAL